MKAKTMPTKDELRIMQAYPLDLKIKKTKQRIREFVDYFGEQDCAISFSGGKDSTVLLHTVRELYPNMEAVFCNTTLEYPEIQKFAKSFDNVTVISPHLTYAQVIEKYGYPFISKEVSERVYNARRCLAVLNAGGYKYIKHYYQIAGTFPDKGSATVRDWGFL